MQFTGLVASPAGKTYAVNYRCHLCNIVLRFALKASIDSRCRLSGLALRYRHHGKLMRP